MRTRRETFALLAGAAALAAGGLAAGGRGAHGAAEPTMGDDGLYKQPWFLESFLVLAEDLEQTTREGKRLALLWEQRGCPYCRDLHLVNLARPEIADYVRSHFNVIQLNLWGARIVTDFDGEALSEKALARKYRVAFTPTLQFFPESTAEMAGKEAPAREVARLPGYFRPFHFVAMFEFVREKRYARMDFQDYIREKSERAGAGPKPAN
jgi:thioredoxin-related protein